MTDTDPRELLNRLGALGDMARLRVLRLLHDHELSVGELSRALQLPQSTVSRHLKLLHEGDWITKRTAGTTSLYRVLESSLDPPARSLWQIVREQLGDGTTIGDDDIRLTEVLAARRADSRSFFGRVGGEWNQLRTELFGTAFTNEALHALIDPDLIVADIGCGTGNAAELLAPYVKKVIAIDREPAMLDAARKRLKGVKNVEFRAGDLLDPPLRSGEADAAVFFLVLHHINDPAAAIHAAARCLRKQGIVLVADMVAHDRESYHQTMGHLHLGFDEKTVRTWAKQSGLAAPRYRRLRPDTEAKGPGLFVATLRSK